MLASGCRCLGKGTGDNQVESKAARVLFISSRVFAEPIAAPFNVGCRLCDDAVTQFLDAFTGLSMCNLQHIGLDAAQHHLDGHRTPAQPIRRSMAVTMRLPTTR